MNVGSKNNSIAIYPSALHAFSYIVLGLILLFAGIYFIHSDNKFIYKTVLSVVGIFIAVYGIINLALRKHPVILFDEYGLLYSTYAQAKLFIPKEMILAVSLRNTPNKRIIITLKPMEIEQEYKKYLKNIHLPPHLQICNQNTKKIKGNNIIIQTESLNVDNSKLLKQLQNYLDN